MEIIPAIDIINGKCVRLTEGDYALKTEYTIPPLEMAKLYELHGIRRLHLVDLDGARQGKVVNWDVATQIARHTNLVIDFGGGVKTAEEIERIIDLGIGYVVVGSMAVKQPTVFASWVERFGPDQFMLGADVKDDQVMVSGWQEKSLLQLFPFLQMQHEQGIRNVFCTDISKDGRLEGPATALYQRIIEAFPAFSLIASGGVSTLQDLYALRDVGCTGAIIGKAIYENRISLQELQEFITGQ